LKTLIAYIQKDKNLLSTLKGVGILYITGAISIAVTFLQQITTASALGADLFGRFATLIGSIRLATLLVDFRTWEAATKLISQSFAKQDKQEAARLTTWLLILDIVSGSFACLVIIILNSWIASVFLKAPELYNLVILIACTIPFTLLAIGVPTTIIRLYSRFDLLATKSILYAIIRFSLISGPALLGLGLEVVVLGFFVSEVIQVIILWWMMLRVWRKHNPENRLISFNKPQHLPQHLKLLRELWIGSSLAGLQLETFIPIMAFFTTPAQVGLYRVSQDIAQLLLHMVYPLTVVIHPSLIKIYEQEPLINFIRYIKQSIILITVPVIIFVVAMLFFAPIVLPRLLGEEYANAALVTSILVVGVGFNATTVWLRPAIVAVNALAAQNKLSFGLSIILILSLLVFANQGAIAAAILMTLFLILHPTLSFITFQMHLRQAQNITLSKNV
jgi:O-antigen/teichoic acid export membrane protein